MGSKSASPVAEPEPEHEHEHEEEVPPPSIEPPPCTQPSLSERSSIRAPSQVSDGDTNTNTAPGTDLAPDPVIYNHSGFWGYVDDMLTELRDDCRARAEGDADQYRHHLNQYVLLMYSVSLLNLVLGFLVKSCERIFDCTRRQRRFVRARRLLSGSLPFRSGSFGRDFLSLPIVV